MITQLGRFSLMSIISNIGDFDKLWIPDITCSEVLNYLSEENINYHFYNTKLGKPINLFELNNFQYDQDIILIVHHFGIIDSYEHLEKKFKEVIYDFTQLNLSPKELFSIPVNSFSSFRKYTRFKYGSFSNQNHNFKKNIKIDLKISLGNIFKNLILGFDLLKFLYNRKQGNDIRVIQPMIGLKEKQIKLTLIETILFKQITWKIRIYSKMVNGLLENMDITILNRSDDSFFALINSDISQTNIDMINNLGFNIYSWPETNSKSHEAANSFNKSYFFINYDIPFLSYLLLKFYRFEK